MLTWIADRSSSDLMVAVNAGQVMRCLSLSSSLVNTPRLRFSLPEVTFVHVVAQVVFKVIVGHFPEPCVNSNVTLLVSQCTIDLFERS